MKPPKELGLATGFLTDKQIRICLKSNLLLENGTWDDSSIRHASYTLRLGEDVHIAKSIETAHADSKNFTIQKLIRGQSITLKPGDTALLYSIERLKLPDWILGFTVARGLLYTEGLAPENTYIDPGFTGPIYTTVTNISNRVISLEYGIPIARVFFYKLTESVENSYSSGSALGIVQQLKSVQSVAFGTPELCRVADFPELIEAIRQTPTSGMHLAEYCKRQKLNNLRVVLFAIFWPLTLIIANNSTVSKITDGPIISNVIAGLLTAAITTFAPRILKLFSGKN